jgi:hypothetical protein
MMDTFVIIIATATKQDGNTHKMVQTYTRVNFRITRLELIAIQRMEINVLQSF